VRDAKVAYVVARTGEKLPYEPVKPFTLEEAEEWLGRVKKLREKIVGEFGPTDVTELLRENTRRGRLDCRSMSAWMRV